MSLTSSAVILICGLVAFGKSQGQAKLDKLPIDVAEVAKDMAWYASWHTANVRMGSRGDATNDEIRFNENAILLHELVTGLGIISSTVDSIKWGAWNAAWYTANTRKGYKRDAKSDLRRFTQHFEDVRKAGVMTDQLVDNIKWMCWNAAWHCANTRKGYKEDAKSDLARFEKHFRDISDEALLIDVRFDIDDAKVLSQKPSIVAQQMIINKSDMEQVQEFSFTHTKGTTSSWSQSVGFKIGVKNTFKTGFGIFLSSETEISFETSFERSFGSSSSDTTEVRYSFPVKAGPRTSVKAKALVTEANMNVPYELTFKIGSQQRKIQGTWKGVGYSKATLVVEQLAVNKI